MFLDNPAAEPLLGYREEELLGETGTGKGLFARPIGEYRLCGPAGVSH